MRAAILARVSTDGQEVQSQIADMRARVARDGCSLEERHVYVDDGVSGRTGNLGARADLLRLLRDVVGDPRPWDRLYFFEFDRLARSEDIEEQGRILGPLQRAGVDLVTRNGVQPPLSSALGRIWAHWQLEGAAEWLAKHKAQIKRGKDAAIASGRKPAGPTPFGYTYDRETGTWGIDEAAAAVVRDIFARVAAGDSCGAIARELDLRGVRRPRAGRWSRERVWAIATARTYMGSWVADKRRKLSVPVPVIVEPEAWHATEAVLVGLGHRGLPRSSRCALLESLCHCAICRSPILIMSRGRHLPSYYVCKSRVGTTRSGGGCGLPWRQVPEVDAEVWRDVVRLLAQPEQLAAAIAGSSAGAEETGRDWARDLAGYEQQLQALEERQRGLVQRFADGQLEDADLDLALQRNKGRRALLRQSIDAARAQLARRAQATADVDTAIATLATLGARLEDATPEVKREIVRLLVPVRRSLAMGPEAVTGDLLVPTDGESKRMGDGQSINQLCTVAIQPRVPLRVVLARR